MQALLLYKAGENANVVEGDEICPPYGCTALPISYKGAAAVNITAAIQLLRMARYAFLAGMVKQQLTHPNDIKENTWLTAVLLTHDPVSGAFNVIMQPRELLTDVKCSRNPTEVEAFAIVEDVLSQLEAIRVENYRMSASKVSPKDMLSAGQEEG